MCYDVLQEMTALHPTLGDAMPDFAANLASILRDQERDDLANQVPTLQIIDRCDCGEPDCATFYTAPRSLGAWGGSHQNLVLPVQGWDLILDLLEGRIVCIEILDRPDLKLLLDTAFRPCKPPDNNLENKAR